MILKILIIVAVFFGIKTVLKASKIVNDHKLQKNNPNSNNTDSANEDIVEAEYKVVKD